MLEINTILALSKNTIIQALPEIDQYYVFNTETGEHFKINATAYWVLETIGKIVTFEDLLKRFAETYGLNERKAKKDILDILNIALENQIITRR